MIRRLLPLAALVVSGCAGLGEEGTGSAPGCIAFRPIYVSREDTLTERTANDILLHNETGRQLCRWKPKGAR